MEQTSSRFALVGSARMSPSPCMVVGIDALTCTFEPTLIRGPAEHSIAERDVSATHAAASTALKTEDIY